MKPARNIENIMNALSIYAQKQTNGDVWLIGANGKREAIYPSDHSYKPTRKQKNVTLNCCKWKLVWLPNPK